MDEKNYTLTEEPSTEASECDIPERRSVEVTIKKRTDVQIKGDHHEKMIAVMSVMLFVFTIILVLAITLINSIKTTGDDGNETDPDSSEVGGSVDGGNFENEGTINDYRDKPSISSHQNAAESTTAYRPTGSAAKAIKVQTGEDKDGITSKAALLYDATTGTIVVGNAIDDQIEIASMTKVMTLIVACDLIKSDDMYKEVKITYDQARMEGYSTCYINKNNTPETVYVVDLLYGLILESGADCAYGLAESLAGSESAFVEKMNAKAAAIGLSNTKFTNCVGKDDYGKNYSTMRDVATMLNYAMKNVLCYNILTTEKWIPVGDYDYAYLADGSYEVRSMVHAGIKKQNIGSVSFLGGKSGNEINAGFCLVSAGEYSGKTYICVTAGHASSSYADTAYIYKNYVK